MTPERVDVHVVSPSSPVARAPVLRLLNQKWMRSLATLVAQVALAAGCATHHDPADGAGAHVAGANVACSCGLDQVCAADGACVARPPQNASESFARVELLEQVSPLESNVLAHVAEAQAVFNAGDPLPKDTRTCFTTEGGGRCSDAGENCFFEIGTTYPTSYGRGESWPTTPGLDAGKVSFEVSGATGPIELDPRGGEVSRGWGYTHAETPPALRDRTTTVPDFFDPVFVPSGRPMTVTFAGADDVAASRIAGELPQAFTITAPAVEAGNAIATAGQDLTVAWAPPQTSAYMEIFVTMDLGGDLALLSCRVKDDGMAVIPAAAMSSFAGSLGLQLRRTTERYTRLVGASGKVLHASLLGRHARLGAFTMKSP